MATLPEPMHTTAVQIYRAYEADAEDGRRPHLGASLIGHPCERHLWLTFRWAKQAKHPGELLRLFETGKLEEPRVVRNLRRIGVEVLDERPEGGQWQVWSLGGHFGGSMDSIVRGLAEAPKTWHVLETKTHNAKSYKDLVSKGVREAKPQHWAQMQTYMGLASLERALYFAVCKDNDAIYTERVEFDPVEFKRLEARAERVLRAAEPPLRCSNDPSWYVCKMCDHHSLCHGQEAPDVSCRTCAHSTPVLEGEGGRWTCEQFGEVGYLAQLESHRCPSHRYIPILLERIGVQKDVVDGDVVYETEQGPFANGQAPSALSSNEIKACQNKAMLADAARIKRELAETGIDSRVVA